MNPLVIANFLAALASAALQPGVGNEDIAKWARLASLITRTADDFVSELQSLTAQIQQMVDEDRNPTPEEWQSLGMRSDMLTDAINRAAAQ